MKKNALLILTVLGCMVIMSCASAPPAPMTDQGYPYEIMVHCDRGNPPAEHADSVEQIADWMERDLVNRLNSSGYKAQLINSKSDFAPQDGRYLLYITVTKYNPGSSAARMIVGFGAGSASMDNSYDMYGKAKDPFYTWDDGVGTSGDWRRIARKMNENTVKKVNANLSE